MLQGLFKLTLKLESNLKCLCQMETILEVFQHSASLVASRCCLHEICVECSEKNLQCLSRKYQQLILLPLCFGSFINTLL